MPPRSKTCFATSHVFCSHGRTPPLLERLNIDPEPVIVTNRSLMCQFGSAIGTPEHLTERCVARQMKFLRGIRTARELFERKAA